MMCHPVENLTRLPSVARLSVSVFLFNRLIRPEWSVLRPALPRDERPVPGGELRGRGHDQLREVLRHLREAPHEQHRPVRPGAGAGHCGLRRLRHYPGGDGPRSGVRLQRRDIQRISGVDGSA